MTYKLHCFAQSGHSYKAALMLALSGVEWEPVWVDFFNGEARTPEFRALNPMGECPVFDGDGLTLTQSGVIIDYLSEKTGKYRYETEEERREILRWTLWENHKLNCFLGIYRFMLNFAPESARAPELVGFLKGRALGAVKILEGHLADRDWVAADRATAADVACSGYVFYPGEEFQVDWADYPNLSAWKARMQELPGWRHPYDLMPGAPESWKSG